VRPHRRDELLLTIRANKVSVWKLALTTADKEKSRHEEIIRDLEETINLLHVSLVLSTPCISIIFTVPIG
jgi:hypothetical protein